MPIRACPTCGSDRLEFPKRGEAAFTCNDCSWSGTPTEYPSWAAWQEARKTRAVVA